MPVYIFVMFIGVFGIINLLNTLITNILTRKLNVSADRLYNDYGIRYESKRTHEGRVVKLTLENSGA